MGEPTFGLESLESGTFKSEHIGLALTILTLGVPLYGAAQSGISLALSSAVQVSLFDAVNQPLPGLVLNGLIPFGLILLSNLAGYWLGVTAPIRPENVPRLDAVIHHLWRRRALMVAVIVSVAGLVWTFQSAQAGIAILILAWPGIIARFVIAGSTVARVAALSSGALALGLLAGSSSVASAGTYELLLADEAGLSSGTFVVVPQNGGQLLLFECADDGRPRPGVILQASLIEKQQTVYVTDERRPAGSGLDLIRADAEGSFGFQPACP